MSTNTRPLPFTADEQAALQGVCAYISSTFKTDARCTFHERESGAQAYLEVFGNTAEGNGWSCLAIVQITGEPGKRFCLADVDGASLTTSDEVTCIVAELEALAGDTFAD